MDTKDLMDICLICLGVFLGALASMAKPRIRDIVFFLLALGIVIAPYLSISFVNYSWYQGTSTGLEFSLVEVLALGLLVALLLQPKLGQPLWFWPASFVVMLLFLAYCGVSVALSEPRMFGLLELAKMVRGLLLFLVAALFIRGRTELAILVVALGCATCLEAALAFKSYYWNGLALASDGLEAPGSRAMYLCMMGPIFVAAATSDLPRYVRWFAGFCAAVAVNSVLMTVSWVGLLVFALVMLGTLMGCLSREVSPRHAFAVLAVCLGVGAAFYQTWDVLKAKYADIPAAEETASAPAALADGHFALAETMVKDQPLGVGLNNWSYWVSKTYGAQLNLRYQDYDGVEHLGSATPSVRHAPPARNLVALTAGELGWPGLLLFVLLWLRWMHLGACFLRDRRPECTERLGVGLFFAVAGVFVLSFTEAAFWQTSIFFTFNILLGTLAGLYHREPESHPEEDTVFLSARRTGSAHPWQLAK